MAKNLFRGFERQPAAHARTAVCFDGIVQAGAAFSDGLVLSLIQLR